MGLGGSWDPNGGSGSWWGGGLGGGPETQMEIMGVWGAAEDPLTPPLVCPPPNSAQVKRKILVLDLDETLIHSHHDGVLRPTVRPGTPPDFILKVGGGA